jgi:WD40 repeat protein
VTAIAEPLVAAAGLRSSPYVGLQPYGEEDAVFFFGREAERKIISANLGASRLTVLYAESGVGKSSVLRAGVAHHLRSLAEQNALERGGPRVLPVVFANWPDDPVEGLTRAIREAAAQFDGGADLPAAPLDETIAAVNERLEARPMIILDQFEEYFRYHAAAANDSFAEQFVTVVNRPDLRAGFVVAVREDALARLDLFQGRIPDLLANYVRMDHLDVDAARAAIARPLEVYDAMLAERGDPRRGSVPSRAEPALVEQVLREVAAGEGDREGERSSGRRIETPHLQLVLRRLWDEECKAGSTELRLATLEAIGGAQRIIETHLDETMEMLTAEERDLAAHLFRQFVTPSGTKYAHTISDLVDLTDQPEAGIAAVLDQLARPGSQILRAVAPAPGKSDGYRYEISHDVLGRAVLDWRRRHEEEEKDRRVVEAEEEAREANEKHLKERRRARIFRGLMIASLVLLGLSIAAGVYAYRARVHANEEAELAASSAVGRKASTLLDQKYRTDAAVLAAFEAYRLEPTFEARRAVLAGLQSDPSLGGELAGHYWTLSAVAFSPNSQLVATGSDDGTVRLWNAGTREPIGNALLPSGGIADLVFLDDTRLAVGSDDVSIWDVTQPESPHRLSRVGSRSISALGTSISALDYARDAKVLVVGGAEYSRSELWDVRDPAKPAHLRTLETEPNAVDDIAISADGTKVAAVDKHGLNVWGSGRRPTVRGGDFSAVAFTPDGETLATGGKGSYNGGIRLWDVRDPSRPHVKRDLDGHLNSVKSLAFNDDGSLLLSAGNDKAVLLWDVDTGLPLGGPRTHTARVAAVAFAGDGHFASAGRDWVARIWEVGGSPLAIALGSATEGSADAVAIAAGGLIAGVGYQGGDALRVLLWKKQALRAGEPNRARPLKDPGNHDPATVVAAGDILAVATDDGVAIWRVAGGRPQKLPGRLPVEGTVVAISPDGKRLASANDYNEDEDQIAGRVSLWDLEHPERRSPLAQVRVSKNTITDLAFSGDGKLAAAINNGNVRLLDVSRDALVIRSTLLHAHVRSTLSVAFAPDNSTLATGGWDDQIVLWNVRDPKRPDRLRGSPPPQPNTINDLAFSHDGRLLAAGIGNGDTVLWDVQRRESLGSPLSTSPGKSSPDGSVTSLEFAPDDRYLVAGGNNIPLVVWSSVLWSDDFETLRKNVCAIVDRDLTKAEWADFFADTPFEGKWRPTCSGEDNR